ncbi:MerR family transcriptional regulator [Acidobacteria bacterium AH-259-D05]|nr:MerR family transcriptional regulator [Acidobacteria bacterium AH-259-D05]
MAKKKVVGFTISTVATRYEIHPQTLRSYEREGLLQPSRTEGNTRLYTEEDLKQLELILTLTRELGVNLAGVEVILHMREKMERMHDEMGSLIEYLRNQFDLDPDLFQRKMKEALVPLSPLRLTRVVRSDKTSTTEKN